MRPNTLFETCDRILHGEPAEKAVAEFLDMFYGAPDATSRFRMLVDVPPFTGDDRLDAFMAASAEYLARQYRLPDVPAWTADPRRKLAEPWFTTASDSAGMREFLTFSSPAEFASRNIFTEELPLRRASQARMRRAEADVAGMSDGLITEGLAQRRGMGMMRDRAARADVPGVLSMLDETPDVPPDEGDE